jgi:hypothetical protein
MLSHLMARDAMPFGATLLTAGLILQGACPLTPDTLRVASRAIMVNPGGSMPFEKHGDEPLDAVINIRLKTAEKARLQEDADLAAISMSELVRRRFFGRPVLASADQAMIRELRRLGGLLKHLHNETGGVLHRDTAAVLAALKAYIERLSHDRQED